MDRERNRFWSFHNDATGKCPVLENEVFIKEEQNGFLKGKQGRSRDHGLGLCCRVSESGCHRSQGGEPEGEEPRDGGLFLMKKLNPEREGVMLSRMMESTGQSYIRLSDMGAGQRSPESPKSTEHARWVSIGPTS